MRVLLLLLFDVYLVMTNFSLHMCAVVERDDVNRRRRVFRFYACSILTGHTETQEFRNLSCFHNSLT